ncbi:uncharacterized protein [Panulirus ornatus]|uniref:uncharacterized protein isoform X2 n=1 Tax=Panulirus ornatus TaxID=150431 RepID=UPI003A84F5DF
MKLVVFLAVLGCALAAPQALDPDAETVFTPERSPPEGVGNGTIVIVNPNFFNILRGLFGGGRVPDGDPTDQPPQGFGGLPSFFRRPFISNVFPIPFFGGSPQFPSFGTGFDDLPDNYDNSTHEVKVVNDSRIEINRTTTKKTGDGGVFIINVHSVRTLPDAAGEPAADDGGQGDTLPEGNTDENQVDPAQNDGVSEPSKRHSRWILEWLSDVDKRSPADTSDHEDNINAHESRLNAIDLPSDRDAYIVKPQPSLKSGELDNVEVDGIVGRPDTVMIPIRNNDDIAVNYIGASPPPFNPDAEVIDFDLIREDKRRFFESRSEPLRSQPMMSQANEVSTNDVTANEIATNDVAPDEVTANDVAAIKITAH